MRWGDENYIKVFTRDTPTWKAMCWQAKALWPLLMRKLDKAGLLECGELGRSAVSLMVDLPEEVVTPGLKDLERLGCIRWHGQTLEAPKFEEAQESRKSDVQKKRDERQKAKDKARAEAVVQAPVTPQGVSPGVTSGHPVSHLVPLQTPQTPQPSSVVATSASVVPPTAPASPPLDLLPTPAPKAKKDRKLSAAEKLRDALTAQRTEVLGDVVPDVEWGAAKTNAQMAGRILEADKLLLLDAHRLYLEDERAQGADPPCPLSWFVADWPKWISIAAKNRGVA